MAGRTSFSDDSDFDDDNDFTLTPNPKRVSYYENLPRRKMSEDSFCLGILKTVDGSHIFKDLTLCEIAAREVCRMNLTAMTVSASSLGSGNALKIPMKLANPDVPLLHSEFTFANTECIFYLIDSRPQNSPDVSLSTPWGTLKRTNSRITNRESEKSYQDNVCEDCMPLPEIALGQCSDITLGECSEECMRYWVERNAQNAIIIITSLAVILLLLIVVLLVVVFHWPSKKTEVIEYDEVDAVYSYKELDEELEGTLSSLTLEQLYEKQERELADRRLDCKMSHVVASVIGSLEPTDPIIEVANVTQRMSLAKCPSDAFCPIGYRCFSESIIQKRVSVHLVKTDKNSENYASRDVWEDASCSCQLIEDWDNLPEMDVDFDEELDTENNTKRSTRSADEYIMDSSSNNVPVNAPLKCFYLLTFLLARCFQVHSFVT